MKKSVRYLSLLLIILMPLSAFAEMWSPNRVRGFLDIGGSYSEAGLGAIDMSYKASGVTLATATAEDKESDRAMSGTTLHYIMDLGVVVGLYMYSSETITTVKQTSVWTANAAAGGAGTLAANTVNALASPGDVLGYKYANADINFLDVGYFYDMKDIVDGMSVAGGLGLAIGGSGETKIVYGSVGYILNGNVWNETITADSSSAMSYFVDLGYDFGGHEAIFGLRNISTSGSATVSTEKGIGKVLGKDKFESSSTNMVYSLGYGYVF